VLLLSKHRIVYGVGKCHIATSKVVFGVASDTFHWVAIEEGAYKVEVHSVVLLETTLIFSNSNFQYACFRCCCCKSSPINLPCHY
jgi:hypothetical protein